MPNPEYHPMVGPIVVGHRRQEHKKAIRNGKRP